MNVLRLHGRLLTNFTGKPQKSDNCKFFKNSKSVSVWIEIETYLMVMAGRSAPTVTFLFLLYRMLLTRCDQKLLYDKSPRSESGFSGEPNFPSNLLSA